jgi:hypothetical protein
MTLTGRLLGVAALLLAGCASKPAPPVQGPHGAATGGGATATALASAGPLTAAQIAERATPSVVLIRTRNAFRKGLGTGFVVSSDGQVVTNWHVIREASDAIVELADGRKFPSPIVMAVDRERDLALLRVPAANLPALPLADSDRSRPGETVVAIGHPLGLGNTVSHGLVSAIRRVNPRLTLLQISAPIAPGSSGGPLLNDRGQVVGIATLYGAQGQNLNFGVPSNYLKPLLLAKSEGRPLARFAQQFRPPRSRVNLPLVPKRDIPRHPVSMLNDCSPDQVHLTADTIRSVIDIGAPLYNQGNIAGCSWAYEGAARDLVRRLRGCAGVKRALQKGLNRAGGVATHVAHAWAMRDTFDGLVDVIQRKQGP